MKKTKLTRNFTLKIMSVSVSYTHLTEIERKAVEEATYQAGAREVFLVEEPIAAAIGAGVDVTKPFGNLIVDIGGGTTDAVSYTHQKSKEANLEKNSSVSEESKKINNTDKIENKDNSEMSEIIENSENHLNSETQPANTLPQSNIVLPHPILDLSRDKLSDYDYLMNNFYIVDENTDASAVKINAAEFLAEDFSLSHGPLEPQILIYHSHSQDCLLYTSQDRRASCGRTEKCIL